MLLITAWVKDQFSIKAVYLVHGQGELDQSELAKHPEIAVTGSFEKFKGYAKQRVALWIDKNALTMIDKDWLRYKPQVYYPMVLIGYGDDNYSFENKLGMSCIIYGDPFLCASLDKLSANRPAPPGFSVLQLKKLIRPVIWVSPCHRVLYSSKAIVINRMLRIFSTSQMPYCMVP